ncbi:MAG: hypothetical protein NT000_05915 [Proteobacteria bacterium]|nr:hypothetical protein [Pseudomonadota bacterium]
MTKLKASRRFLSSLENQRGDTLIGVVAAGVISALIGLGTYSMISSQIRAQQLVGASSERTILRAQIQGILGDVQVCGTTLKDSSGQVAKYNPDSVLPPNPTPAQRTTFDQENSLSKITLSSMVLSQDGAGSGSFVVMKHTLMEVNQALRTSVTVNGIAGKRIVGQLKIDLGRVTSGLAPTMTSSISFPLFMVVNDVSGANKFNLLQCSSQSTSSNPPGGAQETLLPAPRLVGYSSNGAGSSGTLFGVPNQHSKLHQWVKVPTGLPAGTQFPKIKVLTSQGCVFLSGKAQAKPAWNSSSQIMEPNIFPLLVTFSSNNTQDTNIAEVPLEDDGSFSFLVHNRESTVTAYLSVVSYR